MTLRRKLREALLSAGPARLDREEELDVVLLLIENKLRGDGVAFAKACETLRWTVANGGGPAPVEAIETLLKSLGEL